MAQWMIFALLAIFWSTTSLADSGLPRQCMQSFSVKDKPLVFASTTSSCRAIEARRGELFAKINALGDTGEINGAALAQELSALEVRLAKEQKAKNWIGLTGAVSGNALATIGLAACLETAGAGCALAVVGKVLAIVGLVDSADSEAERDAIASSLRKEVEAIRKKYQGRKSPAKVLRDRMVNEFSHLCGVVMKQCV